MNDYDANGKKMDDFGMSRVNADWIVSVWCSCYGAKVLGKNETLERKEATLKSDFEAKTGKEATFECDFRTKEELEMIQSIKENPFITQKELHEKTGISLGTVKRILPGLQEKGVLVREGGKRFGKWIVTDKN